MAFDRFADQDLDEEESKAFREFLALPRPQMPRPDALDHHMAERAALRKDMTLLWPSTPYMTAEQLERLAPSAPGALQFEVKEEQAT